MSKGKRGPTPEEIARSLLPRVFMLFIPQPVSTRQINDIAATLRKDTYVVSTLGGIDDREN